MNAQAEIARFVSRFATDRLTPELVAAARRCLLDTVAATLVGASSELGDALFDYLREEARPAGVPVIGSGLRAAPDTAAMANGTLGHALDFDDTVSAMPGHPGAVTIGAALSAASGRQVSGRELLAALVVGYEVAIRLGQAIGMGHYNRGWHTTGTVGVFGATATAARILRLDEQATSHALGIAASMSSGLRINFGTMTKPLHSGWAASSGLTAARLAASGMTASADALDEYFAVYGTEASDLSRLTLGAPFAVLEPGIGFKKYACCFALHRAIDAMEQLRADGILGGPVPVARISARVAPGSLKPLLYDRPSTGLEGKFSMQYALAAGVVDGDFSLAGFTDQAVLRPEIRAALELTDAREDPECSPGDPEGRSASAGTRGFVEVAVELADGSRSARQVTIPPGSPARPMSDDDIRAKFRACATFAGLSDDHTAALLARIENIEAVADLGELIELLAGEPAAVEAR